jgi:hypothetical protein
MCLRYGRVSAWYKEGSQRFQGSIHFIDFTLQESNLFITNDRNLQGTVITIGCQHGSSGHLNIQNAEQLIPDLFIRDQVAQHGGMCHQLIYRAIGFNALVILWDTPSPNKGCPTLITTFGIDT